MWTKETPTEPGYYWISIDGGEPELVEVSEWRDITGPVVWFMGAGCINLSDTHSGYEWMKIGKPRLPKK